jgi:hypothetical protein
MPSQAEHKQYHEYILEGSLPLASWDRWGRFYWVDDLLIFIEDRRPGFNAATMRDVFKANEIRVCNSQARNIRKEETLLGYRYAEQEKFKKFPWRLLLRWGWVKEKYRLPPWLVGKYLIYNDKDAYDKERQARKKWYAPSIRLLAVRVVVTFVAYFGMSV